MQKPSRANKHVKRFDPGKKTCQSMHIKKRANERIGLRLTDAMIDVVVSCIKNNKSHPEFKLTYIEDQSSRLRVYRLEIEGREPVNLIYDKHRCMIVTILYPDSAENVYHFYDFFGNKVNIKSEYGGYLKLKGNVLEHTLASGVQLYYPDVERVYEIFDKRMKFIDEDLTEVM